MYSQKRREYNLKTGIRKPTERKINTGKHMQKKEKPNERQDQRL